MSQPMRMAEPVETPITPCSHCGAVLDPPHGELCARCGASLVVCGEYRLGEILGRGSSGMVYAATRLRDGAPVAVKVRSLAGGGSWRAHERFERSARRLAALSHPGLPRVLAFEPMGRSGRAFLVLERFSGGTLHARGAASPVTDAALRALLQGLLEPLAVLHGHAPPLVHRDVSPHNVMFRGQTPVLIDCDALAEVGDDDTTTFVGTPGYVAPEQIGGRATPASDVYAAAATVLFAATGIDADGQPRRRGRVDLSSRRELSPELRALLAAMLASDPRDRPKDAADALRRLAGAQVPRPSRRARTLRIGGIAIGAALVLGVGAAQGGPRSRAPVVDPSSPRACRIATDPPGAMVYEGNADAPWTQGSVESLLGPTPLTIARDPARARPLILRRRGYRPFFLEVAAPRAGEPPCAFTARLVED